MAESAGVSLIRFSALGLRIPSYSLEIEDPL